MNKNKKIVIADDNIELCKLIVDIFSDLGYEVDSVHNGYELLSYLEANNPALIILDLMMPEKTGMSVFNTIKQVSPYSRIVIYSGYQEYENSIYARTADKFLVKGGDIEHLIGAVEDLT